MARAHFYIHLHERMRERGRERDRQTNRQTDRETETEKKFFLTLSNTSTPHTLGSWSSNMHTHTHTT